MHKCNHGNGTELTWWDDHLRCNICPIIITLDEIAEHFPFIFPDDDPEEDVRPELKQVFWNGEWTV